MDYKIEKITMVGKDENLNYYYQTENSLDRMILDKETAFALIWQLMAEKMGVAFEEIESNREFEKSKKLY